LYLQLLDAEDPTSSLPTETICLSHYDFLVWTPSGSLFVYVVKLCFAFFQPPPVAPEFPPFPIKACILGKSFSGKSSTAQRLADGEF